VYVRVGRIPQPCRPRIRPPCSPFVVFSLVVVDYLLDQLLSNAGGKFSGNGGWDKLWTNRHEMASIAAGWCLAGDSCYSPGSRLHMCSIYDRPRKQSDGAPQLQALVGGHDDGFNLFPMSTTSPCPYPYVTTVSSRPAAPK
jgi:hypothetical protein